MKTSVLKTGFVILFMCSMMMAVAQKPEETITIKSTLACQTCVDLIQKDLPYKAKGIKTVKADFKTDEIVVTYKTDKTNPDDIRNAIASLGYDADNVKANETAFKKLPAHCQEEITAEKAAQKPGCQQQSGKKPCCKH